MKKLSLSMLIILCMTMFLPTTAYANMAAPQDSDIGSSITFEKNEDIAVLSEVLDIVVTGTQAEITATYTMKNTTYHTVTTTSMFLSPNIVNGGTEVLLNGTSADFLSQSYDLDYSTKIDTDDWQYVVLTERGIADTDENTVDTVTFEMTFAPNEQYDVVVSYTYNLGGYPDYDFNVKCGEIYYYLAPATMWKDFESLTINLILNEDMPVITHSNLEFEKVASRTYQYTTDTLPTENLEITIDENWFQNIFSTLRSPYLPMMLMMFSPFIVIALVVIIFVVWRVRKRRKGA
ncbi:MAG: hypothetical protein R3Y09_00550 [Clostridia bacterium]